MNKNWKHLFAAIAVPIAAGTLSAFLVRQQLSAFSLFSKPPLTPPSWLFPIVWVILYLLMGISSYFIIQTGPNMETITAFAFYLIQLLFHFLWPIWFFLLGWYLFSFFWLTALWGLILVTTVYFYPISQKAAYLMIPYLIWVAFAGYLNYGIYLLN